MTEPVLAIVDTARSPDKYEPVEPKPFTKSESYEFINRSQVREAAKKVIFF